MTTMNKYNEIRDLHPRVKHILTMKNWCVISEARFLGGRIDFLAIQRDTGNLMVVECKVEIGSVWQTIGQLNGYHVALGVPNAIKSLAVLQDVSDSQYETLAENDIDVRVVGIDTPLMDRWMGGHKREFIYWFLHWGHEAKEGSIVHQWMELESIGDRIQIVPQSQPQSIAPTIIPNDWQSLDDAYRNFDDLDNPARYEND